MDENLIEIPLDSKMILTYEKYYTEEVHLSTLFSCDFGYNQKFINGEWLSLVKVEIQPAEI